MYRRVTLIILKLLQKTAKEGKFLNSFYEATITLIPKPYKKYHKKRKLQANITDEVDAKFLKKILANQIQQYIKQIICHDQVGSYAMIICKDSSISAINQCDTPH